MLEHVLVVSVVCLVVQAAGGINKVNLRTDQNFWKELANTELEEALRVRWNVNRAKNVILFVGDGMGPNTVTATRIYKGGETGSLVYERFPHIGLLKTYSADKMVPDSACTATALFCGVKVNYETMGVDSTVKLSDCQASLNPEARLKSLAALALEAGMKAGLVTTMRVTHATPGPVYAHSPNRRWECEGNMPAGTQCKDLARQLVEDWPGRDLHVILGGGRQVLVSNTSGSESDPLDTWSCQRQDGRNLIEDYKKDKQSRGLKHSLVFNNEDLGNFDADNTDYLLGIFANGHLKYEHERDKGPEGMPSLTDMVEAAIKVLSHNSKGYFLMVEGGNIDMAHHRGKAKKAIDESAALEAAVKKAVDMTNDDETLIVVTSDHTHSMSINGHQSRGSNIFGIAKEKQNDPQNYTTLSYSTGGPGSFQFEVVDGLVHRRDPSLDNTDSFEYEQIAAIKVSENLHGGGDVAVYAKGPYAHLFHNVHEQHYVYNVISYAAQIGAYSGASSAYASFHVFIVAFLTITVSNFLQDFVI